MENNNFKEKVFLSLTKSIKELIKKVEELVITIQSNNPHNYLAREWIDSTEVCNLLKISKCTLQKYIRQSIFPRSKINGKNFFKPQDIEKVLKNNYTNQKNIKTQE